MKRPSFQFYPADWRNDAGLKLCSLSARGLWIEMICIMHAAHPYGHLCAAGRPLDTGDLSKLVGESERDVKKWLEELLRNNVCSIEEGAIVSRRMVRDESLREKRAAGGEAGSKFGKLGAEHGNKGGRPKKETGDKKPPLPPHFKQNEEPPFKPPPSSSSSSSSSPSGNSVPVGTGGAAAKLTDPSEIIFGYGLGMLTSAGTAEKQARSFLGGLRKMHGDDALIDKLRECAKAKPLQPLEWLAAALPPPSAAGKRAPKPENFAAKDYGDQIENV